MLSCPSVAVYRCCRQCELCESSAARTLLGSGYQRLRISSPGLVLLFVLSGETSPMVATMGRGTTSIYADAERFCASDRSLFIGSIPCANLSDFKTKGKRKADANGATAQTSRNADR